MRRKEPGAMRRRKSHGFGKKAISWFLVTTLMVSFPITVPTAMEEAKAAESATGISTMLNDRVTVKVGKQEQTLQLYNQGVYECKFKNVKAKSTATLYINGEKAATEEITEGGNVYVRLAQGEFYDSQDDQFVKSAALVGNFAGIEFVNKGNRSDVKAGDGERYDITAWNPADENAELDYLGGGLYKRTFYFNELAADVEVADTGYKVAANDSWDKSWGEGDGNIALTIPKGTSELTVLADTVNGGVYDSVRTKPYKVKIDNKKTTSLSTVSSKQAAVSIVGTIRGSKTDNWDLTKKGYEFTQISEKYFIYQTKLQKGSYEYNTVVNQKKSGHSDSVIKVKNNNTNVIVLYDAKADKLYDTVNYFEKLGGLLNMETEVPESGITKNGNDTYQFVFVPEKAADTASLVYGIYNEKTKKVEKLKEASLTRKSNGSFVSDQIYFGDAKAKVLYYYKLNGGKSQSLAGAKAMKVDGQNYAVFQKEAFHGRTISLPGTVNGNGWNPAKESETMTYKGNGIYTLTVKDVGAASYQYKIAIGGNWDENYGADGVEHGGNIDLSVTETQDVTFTYNDVSHMVVNSVDYIFAKISVAGKGVKAKLSDELLKGIYSTTVSLKPGTYKNLKYTWNGKKYSVPKFKLDKAKDVTFYFDPVTEIYYNDASAVPVKTENIYYNSKETAYKAPFGAVATGEKVTFTIVTGTDAKEVRLIVKGKKKKNIKMKKSGKASGKKQKWTVTTSFKTIGEYNYFFTVSNGGSISLYGDDSAKDYGVGTSSDLNSLIPYDLIVYKSGFKTPDWMKNGIVYQIFPERFYDADTSNDLAQQSSRGHREYEYVEDWSTYPENPEQEQLAKENGYEYPSQAFTGNGEFGDEIYGGDVKGIIERMDYLQELGVTVIYLNPICASISSHRYDASDYTKLDPILGEMGDFDELVRAAKTHGMHIVLDGVFNHVADDSKYFDRYYKFLEAGTEQLGAYPYWAYVFDAMKADKSLTRKKAEAKAKEYFASEYGIKDFTYTQWFDFTGGYLMGSDGEAVKDSIGQRAGKKVYAYDCWWGYDSMPVILATNGSEYQTPGWKEEIIGTEEKEAKDDGSIAKFWLEKGSNGWRLDVANEVSDETWQHFRKSVKALSEDNVIIGEIWTDASGYLLGDMYDSVMNYMFRNAVVNYVRDGKTKEAVSTLERLRERYPQEAFYAMMNLVGSHDTTRILSYLDGIDDDRNQKEVEKAFPTYETTSDTAKQLQYVVAFLQMTYAGAPTIYYGDEIGMVGADDPDDRRGFTWGLGNKELVEWYATMAKIRSEYTALRTGTVEPLSVDNDAVMAYIRRDANAALAVFANNSDKEVTITVDFAGNKLAAGSYTDLVSGKTYEAGKTAEIKVPAYRGCILVETGKAKTIKIDTTKLAPAYDSKYIVTKAGRVTANSITMTETTKAMKVGESIVLSKTVTPSNAIDQNGSWSSSDPKVATVDGTGKVTAKKAGTAVITVSIKNGKSASCTINVSK